MRITSKRVLATGAAAVTLTLGLTGLNAGGATSSGTTPTCAPSGSFASLTVVAVTSDKKLLCFNETSPSQVRTATISGIPAGEEVLGIDYRAKNAKLYAVTRDVDNVGRAYTADPSTGVATLAFTITGSPLTGRSFGVDFNPAADRLRVISDTGQNLRIVPEGAATGVTGAATIDGGLKYGAVAASNVIGAAYTNNDNDGNGTTPTGSTGTTLYDIDTDKDQLVIQAPPNDGTLVAIGPLGVNTTNVVGFDMHSTIRNNTTTDIRALAVLTVGSSVGLYRITPFSGKAQLRGALPANVTDIAIPLNQL